MVGFLRILAIEDDSDIRAGLADALGLYGHGVFLAENGEEALSFLATGMRPDVILLDLNMPVMDGRQFLEARAKRPDLLDIPVVLTSGDLQSAKVASEYGLRFVRKPCDIDQLLDILRMSAAAA